jgi:hypothetical protein
MWRTTGLAQQVVNETASNPAALKASLMKAADGTAAAAGVLKEQITWLAQEAVIDPVGLKEKLVKAVNETVAPTQQMLQQGLQKVSHGGYGVAATGLQLLYRTQRKQ